MNAFFQAFLFVGIASTANAKQLVIINPELAEKAAYTSIELADSLPFWIHDGILVDRQKAHELVVWKNQTACTLWMMNFSSDKSLLKANIAQQILFSGSSLELWKIISGKVIFTDPSIDFAISYNCVRQGSAGQLIDADFISDTEFNVIFQNILKIK